MMASAAASITVDLPSTPAAWILSCIILFGALPMLSSVVGYVLVAVHGRRDHYALADPGHEPRVAVLVPAWNEAPVLEFSVDRMMKLDYPRAKLRMVVVDDASTDSTPQLMAEKEQQYPGRVLHLRRAQGGQGKAHTLNHGLVSLLEDDWAEAILITDADVVFEPDAIAKMARHLADPTVGAVTAFIKEASVPPNWMNRYIGYEYVTAQLAARRAHNVVGAQACLAGGAQLLSRENVDALGGQVDTGTLAEDTVTTLLTQVEGRRVVFDPHAQCLAEEPDTVTGLWKQRLRWSRGNVQVSRRFHRYFFRPSRDHHLGNLWFGVQWYSTLLLPLSMVAVSIALALMWFFEPQVANLLFRGYWSVSALAFVFTTTFAMLLAPEVTRRSWFQAVMFPGLVSLAIIAWVLAPEPMYTLVRSVTVGVGVEWSDQTRSLLALAAYLWSAGCMVAAWLAYRLDTFAALRPVQPLLIFFIGFGPLLCAITFAAYVAHLRGAATTWDKTEKTGKVAAQ